jgi:hypothetical protein
LNPSLTTLAQATYLGGSGSDFADALAIHPSTGDVYVAGWTYSTNFPGTTGGAQASYGGGQDAFIARLDPGLTTLDQATYLGGAGDDVPIALAIHPATGDVYVAGYTYGNFPGTTGGAQAASGGLQDAFVARLTADLTCAGNLPPLVTSTSEPSGPIALGSSASVTANFTDGNTANTHTCSIDWGDNISSVGTVLKSNGSGTCTGTHVYAATGVYEVTFTVTDSCNASGTGVFQFLVIYDPEGGFVTGVGWINSPAGAYVADPSLAGKATFGFVSKYQHGATVPTGSTEFDFHTASFNFRSSSYEWMVISGAKARYHGTGQVNGSGSFGFELTAWDGKISGGVDRFRIKVWDQNQGNAVIYDNQMNAPDDSDPTSALEGGSIVIHK